MYRLSSNKQRLLLVLYSLPLTPLGKVQHGAIRYSLYEAIRYCLAVSQLQVENTKDVSRNTYLSVVLILPGDKR